MNRAFRTFAILGLLIGLPSLCGAQEFGWFPAEKEIVLGPSTEAITRPQVLHLGGIGDTRLDARLDLSELSRIEVPEDFSLAENVAWAVHHLLNPGDLRTLVPIYGYRWQDICRNAEAGRSFLDSIETGASLEQGAIDLTVYQDLRHVYVNWHETVDNACSAQGMNDPASFHEDAVVYALSEHLAHSVGAINDHERFLLTSVPLRNVDEVAEYLGVCDADLVDPDSRSVCHARLGTMILN